jgi:hypothetical protein
MSQIGREEVASRAAGGVGLFYGVGFRVDRLAGGGPRKRGKRVKGAASRSSGKAVTLHRFIMVNGGCTG